MAGKRHNQLMSPFGHLIVYEVRLGEAGRIVHLPPLAIRIIVLCPNLTSISTYNRFMDAQELMRRAWEAVEKSGVPEALQETALKEAIDYLKGQELGKSVPDLSSVPTGESTGQKKRPAPKKAVSPKAKSATRPNMPIPDEDSFFARLSEESGVAEQDLRDVLRLTSAGDIHISSPTRNLGSSRAEQAKSVVALVSGARAYGLGEDPVDAEVVREEVKRKRCFDPNNFASKSLTPMKGFNAGATRSEIVLTSKWVDEFTTAIDKALGRNSKKDR